MPRSMFVDKSFLPCLQVPESCIESAEFIIQCIANKSYLGWKEGKTRKPHVMAEFGFNKKFNITTQANFHEDPSCVGLRSYSFGSWVPDIGQGLILLNKKSADASTYNMHFGAIVAVDGSDYYISDVSDSGGGVKLIGGWPVKKITNVNDFRIPGYPKTDYAIGLLYPA